MKQHTHTHTTHKKSENRNRNNTQIITQEIIKTTDQNVRERKKSPNLQMKFTRKHSI